MLIFFRGEISEFIEWIQGTYLLMDFSWGVIAANLFLVLVHCTWPLLQEFDILGISFNIYSYEKGGF